MRHRPCLQDVPDRVYMLPRHHELVAVPKVAGRQPMIESFTYQRLFAFKKASDVLIACR